MCILFECILLFIAMMFLWRGHLSFYAPTTNPIFELILLKSLSSFFTHTGLHPKAKSIFPIDTQKAYQRTVAGIPKEFCYRRPASQNCMRAPLGRAEIFWWQIKPQMMVAVTRHSLTHSHWEVSTSARSPLHITDLIAPQLVWDLDTQLSRRAP